MDYNSIITTELNNLPQDLKKMIELDMNIYNITDEKAGRLFFAGLHKMMESKNPDKNYEILDHFTKSLEIEDNPGTWSYYVLALVFSEKTKEEIHSASIKWLESCIKHNRDTEFAAMYVERFK